MMLIYISLHLIAGSTFPAESSTIPSITSTESTPSHTTKETSWTTKTLSTPSTPGSTLKTASNLELTSNINISYVTLKHKSTDVTKGFSTETYASFDSITNAATRIMENVTFNNTMPPSISHQNVTPVENQSSVSSSTTANQINLTSGTIESEFISSTTANHFNLTRITTDSEFISSSTTANQIHLTRGTTESEFTTIVAAGTTKGSYSLTVIAYGLKCNANFSRNT